MADPEADPGEWMTLSGAAARLGWARDRVEARSRREDWPKRRANRGTANEYLVPASLLAEVTADLGGDAAVSVSAAAVAEALAEVQVEAAEVRADLAAARAELAAELRRSGDLAAAMERAEARAGRLEVELAEARRPLLLRLVEAVRGRR